MRRIASAATAPSVRSTTSPQPDTKAFFGERYDMDVGLYYPNARYMDPALGLFIQPDCLAVTDAFAHAPPPVPQRYVVVS